MMNLPVLNDFIEKHHNEQFYKKGATYPANGYVADPERVAFLQTDKNMYGVPFLGPELIANDNSDNITADITNSEEGLDESVEGTPLVTSTDVKEEAPPKQTRKRTQRSGEK
jgi:hypothetical protein